MIIGEIPTAKALQSTMSPDPIAIVMPALNAAAWLDDAQYQVSEYQVSEKAE